MKVKDSLDRLGVHVPAAAEIIGIICRGGRRGAPGLRFEDEVHSSFRERLTRGPEYRGEADTAGVLFEGKENDQRNKGAVVVKTRGRLRG